MPTTSKSAKLHFDARLSLSTQGYIVMASTQDPQARTGAAASNSRHDSAVIFTLCISYKNK